MNVSSSYRSSQISKGIWRAIAVVAIFVLAAPLFLSVVPSAFAQSNQYSTSVTLDCGAEPIGFPPEQCLVDVGTTVTPAPSAPVTGTVTFSTSTNDFGSLQLSSNSCTLLQREPGDFACSVTVTPDSVGTVQLEVQYSGDNNYLPSSATTTIPVYLDSSGMTTALSPPGEYPDQFGCGSGLMTDAFVVGFSTQCQISLEGYDVGPLSFAQSGSGSVSIETVPSCTGMNNAGSYVYCIEVTGVSTGTVTITASSSQYVYSHTSSVVTTPSNFNIGCSQTYVNHVIGATSIPCTASVGPVGCISCVYGQGPRFAANPVITWITDSHSGRFNATSCEPAVDESSAFLECVVSYSDAGTGVATITANYSAPDQLSSSASVEVPIPIKSNLIPWFPQFGTPIFFVAVGGITITISAAVYLLHRLLANRHRRIKSLSQK